MPNLFRTHRPWLLPALAGCLALAGWWLGFRSDRPADAPVPSVPSVSTPATPPVAAAPSATPAGPANPVAQPFRIVPRADGGRDIALDPVPFRLQATPHGFRVLGEGFDRLDRAGAPDLPVFAHTFEIPAGTRVRVSVTSSGHVDSAGVRVAPVAGTRGESADGETFSPVADMAADASIYETPDFWPRELVSVRHATIGTQTFARVELNPVQAQPVAGVLREHQGLTASVTLEPDTLEESMILSSLSESLPGSVVADRCECSERIWTPETFWPAMTGSASQFARRRAGAEVNACIKIRVTRQGLHQIGQPALVAAGVPAASLVGANLRMFFRDREVAIKVSTTGQFGTTDFIQFYGEPFLSYHTKENFYWLGFGPGGKRIATRAAPPLNGATPEIASACRRQTIETHNSYASTLPATLGSLVYQGGYDGWFVGTVAEPGTATFPAVPLTFTGTNRAVPGNASIESLIWGITTSDLNGPLNGVNHQVALRGHTGAQITLYSFPYVSRNVLTTSVPTSFFNAGGADSIFSMQAVPFSSGGNTVDFDRSGLSYSRLSFERYLYPMADQLMFGGQSGAHDYRLRGFTTAAIQVWDVHDTCEPVELTGLAGFADGAQFGARFGENLGYDACYLAALPSAAHGVAAADISTVSPSALAAPGRQADYLILTPSAYATQVYRLLEHRDQQSLTVAVATLEDIYDEFGFGVRDPHAIKQFLGYAFHHWRGESGQPVRYVGLVGDGTFDPAARLIPDPNVFPVVVAPTHFILTAVDQWYAAVNGNDSLADFAIGRFPAETLANFQRMVDKTISQEVNLLSGAPGAWRTSLHMVAGDAQNAGENFTGDTTSLIAQVATPVGYSATTSYVLNQTDANAARSAITSAFSGGRYLVNFMGHGALDRWTRFSSLPPFDNTAVAGLGNAILPCATVFTCKNGLFQEPRVSSSTTARKSSLAEALLRDTAGGSAVVIAPTGEAIHSVSLPMAREFYNAVLGEKYVQAYVSGSGFAYVTGDTKRVGEALLNGFKAVFFSVSNSARELEFYQIFGDPASRIRAD